MAFVYLFIFIALISILTLNGKNRYERVFLCLGILVSLLILFGFRDINYGGVDTIVYARDYERIVLQSYSIKDIFNNFHKDYGFYLLAQIFSTVFPDVHAWIFACAIPYLAAVTWLIYHYSKNVFLSVTIFLFYDYYLYNFQLMRHVFALAFIIIAFKYLQEERIKAFVVAVLVATTFHMVAIIFLLAYFFRKASIGFKQWAWLFVGGGALIILMQPNILAKILPLLPFGGASRFGQFAERGGGSISSFLIQMMFVLVAWFFLYRKSDAMPQYVPGNGEKDTKLIRRRGTHKLGIFIPHNGRFVADNVNYRLILNLAVVSATFYLGQLFVGEAYRVAQFFSIFTIILVPNTIARIKDIKLRWLIMFVIVLLGAKHFFGGVFLEGSVYNPYVFFWE